MPKEIFEHPVTLEQNVINEDTNFLEVERIEYNKGIFIYLKGHPYPQKGLPTVEGVQAINQVKRLILEALRLPQLFLTPKRCIRAFNRVTEPVMNRHLIKYEFLTPQAQEINDLLKGIDPYLAKIIAHVVEYDAAYRFRLMDLATETSKEKLIENPRKELLRLLEINKQRDYKAVSDKFALLSKVTWLLYIPRYKRLFREAMWHSNFHKLQFDEGDKYWALQKVDYNYCNARHNGV